MWFKAKDGPLLTVNRLQHFLVGALAVAFGAHWGQAGMIVAIIGVSVAAFAWEALTHVLAKFANWKHPYGDLVDYLAFLTGALVVAVVILTMLGAT